MSNLKAGSKEKIYTPDNIIDFMYDLLEQFSVDFEITELLEPCAGSGQMIDRLKYHYQDVPIIAYDIENETKRSDIVECNFLKLKDLDYKKGRVCFMNPPFSKGLKFIYKSLEYCDLCVTITSSNSFMNLDYDKYILEELFFIKKARFSDGNDYGINIMVVKKK